MCPQLIVLFLIFCELSTSYGKDGKLKPKSECYYNFSDKLLSIIALALLLDWGGFWDVFFK